MEGVSLGWNCHSANHGVSIGVRNIKANGYKTCPFDEMVTNYRGIIECILDDFQYLCDNEYLELIQIPKESKDISLASNILRMQREHSFLIAFISDVLHSFRILF